MAKHRGHLSPQFSSGIVIVRNKMATEVDKEMYGLINIIVNNKLLSSPTKLAKIVSTRRRHLQSVETANIALKT